MKKFTGPPPFEVLRRRIIEQRKQTVSECSSEQRSGMFVRQTFRLNRDDARVKAREWFNSFPKAAYWTEVESWRQLDGGEIEFTMRRLPSAD